MKVAQIITETEYTQALIEIRRLIASEPDRGTPGGDRLEALLALAEAFEADLYPLDLDDIAVR